MTQFQQRLLDAARRLLDETDRVNALAGHVPPPLREPIAIRALRAAVRDVEAEEACRDEERS